MWTVTAINFKMRLSIGDTMFANDDVSVNRWPATVKLDKYFK